MSHIHMWSSALQLVVLHIVRKDLQDTLLLITKLGASKDSILILIPTRTSDMTESRSGQCSHDPRKLDLNLPDPRLRRRGGAATIRSEKKKPRNQFYRNQKRCKWGMFSLVNQWSHHCRGPRCGTDIPFLSLAIITRIFFPHHCLSID